MRVRACARLVGKLGILYALPQTLVMGWDGSWEEEDAKKEGKSFNSQGTSISYCEA